MTETLSPETHQYLQQLQRQYFALYPIRLVDFEPLDTTGSCLVPLYKHQDWIVRHLLSTVYQPARDYRRKWLKRLIDVVERGLRSDEASHEEWDLDDRLVDIYSELLIIPAPSTELSSPEPSFKTYLYTHNAEEKSITLFEAQTTIEAGSTGLRTWTASLFLAEALLHHPALLKRTEPSSSEANGSFPPILELGAGTGFLSVFLSQIGCAAVWSSDVGDEDEAGACPAAGNGRESQLAVETRYLKLDSGMRRRGPLDGLIANLELNKESLRGKVTPIRLDWYHSLDQHGNEDNRANMIQLSRDLPSDLTLVATDVVYDPDLIQPLVSTIDLFLTHLPAVDVGSSSRSVLIAATVRNENTLRKFRHVCSTTRLTVDPVEVTRASVPSVFWNANTWEGSEVVVLRITKDLLGNREG